MAKIQCISRRFLNELSTQARASSRLRKNYNLHVSESDPCNRLFNALEPGTYIQPHCHGDATKDETMIVVRGKLALLVFDETGRVKDTAILEAGGENIGVNIPHGVFHSFIVLESGTIFFEAKAGPYRPFTAAEKASWAPVEGDSEAAAYLAELREYLK